MFFYRCKHGSRAKASSNWTQATKCLQNWQRLVSLMYNILYKCSWNEIPYLMRWYTNTFTFNKIKWRDQFRVYLSLSIAYWEITLLCKEIEAFSIQHWPYSRFIIRVWHYMCNTWHSTKLSHVFVQIYQQSTLSRSWCSLARSCIISSYLLDFS